MNPSDEVKRKFIKSLKGKGFRVKTDTGYSKIKYCHKTIDYTVWELKTTRHSLKCADTHIVFYSNINNKVLDEVYVKDLKEGDCISTSDGYDIVTSVKNLNTKSAMYDLELDDDNHRYYTSEILSHNSATTRAYILWYSLFNKDKVVAILGNKLNLAQEQLQQLRDSYMMLPMWMQPGVLQWNKRGIQFTNNTRVICAATSPDGIRGLSINLLFLDEFAFIKPHIADEFIASVFPTISSGKTTKVIITSTPAGKNHFYKMWQKAIQPEKGNNVDFIKSEIPWNAVPGRDEQWAKDEINRIGEIRFNQEYKCNFIGSVSTLIDHHFLMNLKHKEPLSIPTLPEFIRVWELPKRIEELETNEWEYVASLDSGYGVYKDNTVLQIFLVKSNINLHQVCTMYSNSMEIVDFCKKANVLLKKYNNPALIIEQNGPGTAATSYFYGTAEYENLLHFDPNGRQMGLWASEKIKQNAVILLKTYIQRKYMKLSDENTINELHSFGQITQSKWGALGGNNDDHITSTYWIPFYLQSPLYYGNIVDVDIKDLDEEDIILTSEDELSSRHNALSLIEDKHKQLEELSNSAKYLPNSDLSESNSDDNENDEDNEDDDNHEGSTLFFRK